MGKPRKVALITGITGQVSAEEGVRAGPAAAGARVLLAPRSGLPAFPGTAFGHPGRFPLWLVGEVGDKMCLVGSVLDALDASRFPLGACVLLGMWSSNLSKTALSHLSGPRLERLCLQAL